MYVYFAYMYTRCMIAAGHFLLTSLLTDVLVTSQPSRVVTVSSMALEWGSMQWDDLMFDAGYSSTLTYCQSKLANVLFSRELARRLKGTYVRCVYEYARVHYSSIYSGWASMV